MDRKSMLLQAESLKPTMPKDVNKLEEIATEGMAFRMMIETRGWKMLLEKFIKPRSSVNRFLQTKTTQERHEAWGALGELNELMSYIERHIKDGEDAARQVDAIKKGGK